MQRAVFGKRNRVVYQPQTPIRAQAPVAAPEEIETSPERSFIRNALYSFAAVALLLFSFGIIANGLSNSTLGKGEATATEMDPDLRDVKMAYAICDQLNSIGAGTSPCEVGGLSITVHSNSTVAEAQDLCSAAVQGLKELRYSFNAPWTFHVKSPYSGGQSIAYCQLP